MGSILHRDPEMKEKVQRGLGWEGKQSETLRGPWPPWVTAAVPRNPSPYLVLSPGGFPQLLPGSPKSLSEGGQS